MARSLFQVVVALQLAPEEVRSGPMEEIVHLVQLLRVAAAAAAIVVAEMVKAAVLAAVVTDAALAALAVQEHKETLEVSLDLGILAV